MKLFENQVHEKSTSRNNENNGKVSDLHFVFSKNSSAVFYGKT